MAKPCLVIARQQRVLVSTAANHPRDDVRDAEAIRRFARFAGECKSRFHAGRTVAASWYEAWRLFLAIENLPAALPERLGRIETPHVSARGAPQRRPPAGIPAQRVEGCDDTPGIGLGQREDICPIDAIFANASDIGGHDRQAGAHRFSDDDAESFVVAEIDEDISRRRRLEPVRPVTM